MRRPVTEEGIAREILELKQDKQSLFFSLPLSSFFLQMFIYIYIYIYIYDGNGCPLGFERDHLLCLMSSPPPLLSP